MFEIVFDALTDALTDSAQTIPFLIIIFVGIELIEYKYAVMQLFQNFSVFNYEKNKILNLE